MNKLDEEAQCFFNEVLTEAKELSEIRLLEVDPRDVNLCVPNAPDREVSKEELRSIEYLNSVRDIKLRLEANAIELELQLKQQQLAAVRAKRAHSESTRTLNYRLRDHLRLVESSNSRRASSTETGSRQAGIAARLSDLEAREHRFRCRGEKFQDELKITEEITRLVRMSIERLAHRMQLIGHATLDSLISAVEAIRLDANRAEDRLEELRQQTDSMTEQLLGGKSLSDPGSRSGSRSSSRSGSDSVKAADDRYESENSALE
ncbi:hypothetical protein BOX15_Mlig015735g1 [Macrostomum lignano]|uniref:Uncharacterized protein n=2 Tax=Macrostomum lignano TaxID=282301 RepID=A0A267DXN6_9PLAT|nr:hypothetical protein BOX15_Mlig015735g1 [Macrostomum lignano]